VTVIVNPAPEESEGSPQAGEQETETTPAPTASQEVPLTSLPSEAEKTSPSVPAILYLSAAIIVLALLGLTALGVLYITRQRQPVPADELPADLERLWRQRTERDKGP
jgi:hypothetical protein